MTLSSLIASYVVITTQIARLMGPSWAHLGPIGPDGPILAPWTLLSVDYLPCHQWWQGWHRDNSGFSVIREQGVSATSGTSNNWRIISREYGSHGPCHSWDGNVGPGESVHVFGARRGWRRMGLCFNYAFNRISGQWRPACVQISTGFGSSSSANHGKQPGPSGGTTQSQWRHWWMCKWVNKWVSERVSEAMGK